VVDSGLIRNNGLITSNNGDIIVDYNGVLRGVGTMDVDTIILRNGGQFIAGN
jgi:hypothetical protein